MKDGSWRDERKGPTENWRAARELVVVHPLRVAGNRRRSFRSAVEDSPDVDEIVADHSEAHPAVHAAVPLVPAPVEAVAALHHTDAAFTPGSPFLPLAKPPLLLGLLPLGALGVAIRNADAFDAFVVRRLFILG